MSASAESDGNVAVGVGGAVVLEVDRLAIEAETALARKHFARESVRRRGNKVVVPVLDSLDVREKPESVFVRDYLGADRIQPSIAVGMVEVPMGVDQVRDRIGAEIGERLGHLRARDADARVDEHLAVGSGQDGDISP